MKICPICQQQYNAVTALSRTDNKTQICPICATREALDAAGIKDRLRENVLIEVSRGYAAKGILVPKAYSQRPESVADKTRFGRYAGDLLLTTRTRMREHG